MKIELKTFLGVTLMIVGLSSLSSCNENVENLLTPDYPLPSVTKENQGKVLWVVLDGANGEAVRQAYIQRRANHIRSMLSNAYYSFDGLADTENRLTTDSIAWNHLLIGSNDKKNITQGQSVLSIMKSQGKSTALFVANEKLHEKYEKQADAHFYGDDDAVVDRAVASLSADETKDFTIVELGGVKAAGEEYGYFDESNNTATPELIQAIHAADNRIGKIMETLKARPHYTSENWLVMITSNDGGVKDWDADNVYDRLDRKTFTVMYNENIEGKMYQRPSANDILPYDYFTPKYSGSGCTDYATVNDPALFDLTYDAAETDTNKVTNYTIQFMYKEVEPLKKGRSVCLISKALKNDPGNKQGWTVRRDGANFVMKYPGGTGWSTQKNDATINDGIWHVLTYIIDYRKKLLFIYKDGINCMNGYKPNKAFSVNISVGDAAPLTIGKIYRSNTSNNTPFYVSNLQIYNTALPVEWVAKNYKQTHIEKKADSFEYWDNLIGYWPCDREDEYMGNVLHDYSKYGSKFGGVNAGKSDMTITNPVWASGSSAEKNVSPLINETYYQQVINTQDIVYQSLQWMGISIDSSWKLSGIGRAFTYK